MAPKQKPGRSKQNYGTPPEFLIATYRKLGIADFQWDLACEPENCVSFRGGYTEAENSFVQPWDLQGWLWLNPPFGDIGPWVCRAANHRKVAHIAVLVPAGVGANWWRDYVDGKARVLQLNGRLTFVGQTDPYPKDCALLLYGPDVEPGYEVWSWMDLLTPEEKQMAKKKAPKGATKKAKAAKPLKVAKAPKVRSLAAGARKKAKAQKEPKPAKEPKALARVSTFKPNGAEQMQPAPMSSAPDLGPILLPNPEDSQRVLRELAELYGKAASLKARLEELKDLTKTARERYESASEAILDRIRVTTHKSDLPLFDAVQREEDQQAMETAAQAGGPVSAQDAAPDAPNAPRIDEPASEGDALLPAGAVAGEAPTTIPDDDIPF